MSADISPLILCRIRLMYFSSQQEPYFEDYSAVLLLLAIVEL